MATFPLLVIPILTLHGAAPTQQWGQCGGAPHRRGACVLLMFLVILILLTGI